LACLAILIFSALTVLLARAKQNTALSLVFGCFELGISVVCAFRMGTTFGWGATVGCSISLILIISYTDRKKLIADMGPLVTDLLAPLTKEVLPALAHLSTKLVQGLPWKKLIWTIAVVLFLFAATAG